MASKKKPVARKKQRRRNKRAWKANLSRFISVVCVSGLLSFSMASWVLNPQWRDAIATEAILQGLARAGDLKRASLELPQLALDRLSSTFNRFEPQDPAKPSFPAAAIDGYEQTRFPHCPEFFPGQPPIVPSGQHLRELCFSAFSILHSGKTRTPVFVVQRLNRTMLEQTANIERTDRFYAEARLPKTERAELNDYRGSGYSPGHMAPAADMHTDEAMAQSFSLANMVPQDQTHNAGAWSRIENDTRKYVMRAPGDVYVFTGPVYEAGYETIGDGRVAVPTHLYKLVYDATTKRSWVHWHIHHEGTRVGPPIAYEEFALRTGLHLLPMLDAY